MRVRSCEAGGERLQQAGSTAPGALLAASCMVPAWQGKARQGLADMPGGHRVSLPFMRFHENMVGSWVQTMIARDEGEGGSDPCARPKAWWDA